MRRRCALPPLSSTKLVLICWAIFSIAITMNTDLSSLAHSDVFTVNPAFGIEWLKENGYIDIEDASVEAGFTEDVKEKTAEQIKEDATEPLHPIIRREHWEDITDQDWNAMQDSMLLFTRILDDPCVLPWIRGLVDDKNNSDIHISVSKKFKDPDSLVSFQPEQVSTPEQQKAHWKELRQVAGCVKWRFGGNSTNTYATTAPETALPGVPGYYKAGDKDDCDQHIGARVHLDSSWLQVLTGEISASNTAFEIDGKVTDAASALLRTKLYFATTMLHELAHAIWITHTALWVPPGADPNYSADQWPMGVFYGRDEPYYRDQRVNELGYAFMNKTFSGVFAAIANEHPVFPYGIKISKWPGLVEGKYRGATVLASPAKWGTARSVVYPVEMSYVQSIFTQKFWQHDVEAQGMLQALKPPRDVGIRLLAKALDPKLESPTLPIKPVSSPDSPDRGGFDDALGVYARGLFHVHEGRVAKKRDSALVIKVNPKALGNMVGPQSFLSSE